MIMTHNYIVYNTLVHIKRTSNKQKKKNKLSIKQSIKILVVRNTRSNKKQRKKIIIKQNELLYICHRNIKIFLADKCKYFPVQLTSDINKHKNDSVFVDSHLQVFLVVDYIHRNVWKELKFLQIRIECENEIRLLSLLQQLHTYGIDKVKSFSQI